VSESSMESEISPLLSAEVTSTTTNAYASALHQSRRSGPRGQRRFQRRSKIQPLQKTLSTSPPATNNYRPQRSHVTTSVPTQSSQHYSSLVQICASLPYHLLCIASPLCPPCCCLCCCLPCIKTSEYGILERFGKFDRIMKPGMHVIKWPMERVAGRVSVRIRQLDVNCICKSLDHAFLNVSVTILFQANIHQLFQSFYSLSSPSRQLISHTLDVLRSTLPTMSLDDIFASQESIALDLHRTLNGHMNQYGFTIQNALLTRIQPNDHVRQSMNEIEASKRIKESIPHRAEAIKLECVKKAEANAERAYLHGVGVARQRREIARGMVETVKSLNDNDDDTTSISSKATMDLLLLTQYLDVLAAVGGSSKRAVNEYSSDQQNNGDDSSSTSLLLSHMPETVFQMRDAISTQFVAASTPVKVENLLEMV